MKEEQSDDARPKTQVWAVIGKVSVLVGLLIGVRTLYVSFYPSGADITVQAREMEFIQSPEVERVLSWYKDFPSESTFLTLITNKPQYFSTNGSTAELAAESLSRALKQAKPNEVEAFYSGPRHYTRLTIRNLGDKIAEQLVLPLEASAERFVAVERDGTTSQQKVRGAVNLGSVRPHGELIVHVWGVTRALPYGDRAVLSHSTGICRIKEPSLLYGTAGHIGAFVDFCINNPVFVVIVLFLFTLVLIRQAMHEKMLFKDAGRASGKQRKKFSPPKDTTPPGSDSNCK